LEVLPKTGRLPVLTGRPYFMGAPLHLSLAGAEFMLDKNNQLYRSVTLDPGEKASFTLTLTSDLNPFSASMKALGASEDPQIFEKHLQFYRTWFDQNTPTFRCSDPILEKAWLYRWFLVRHRMVRPGTPGFTLPVFYPGKPTYVTLFSTPHILMETRWLRDRFFAQGQIRALLLGQEKNGRLQSIGVNKKYGSGKNWITAAAVGAYEVNGSLQYLKESLPFLKKNFDFDSKAPNDLENASYRFVSAMALHKGFGALGEKDTAAYYKKQADQIQKIILNQTGAQKANVFLKFANLVCKPFEPFESSCYMQCIQAEAIANGIRSQNIDIDLLGFLRAYALKHFQNKDPSRPLLYENSCPDLFNSSFNDLLIRFIGGIVPSAEKSLELWPLVRGLEHFMFSGIPYHGYLLDIAWDKPDGKRIYNHIPEGYVLYVDGKKVFCKNKLERIRKLDL